MILSGGRFVLTVRRAISILIGILVLNLVFLSLSYANVDRKITKVFIQDNHHKRLEVSSISMAFLTEIYQKIQTQNNIPFDYPDDGCFARAHKTSMELEDMGIITVKSFLVGDLRLKTWSHPLGFVQWWYHVATSVHVKEFDQLFVIDPTSSKIPISKVAWMQLLTEHKYGHIDENFETSRFVYAPEDAYHKSIPNNYLRSDIFDMEQALDYYFELLEQRQTNSNALKVS